MADISSNFSIFTFDTDNIGDDMQAMSMMLHLRSVRHFLDREQLGSYKGKRLSIATTAAFPGLPGSVPSADLDPFFWGMCVGSNAFSRDPEWLAMFKKHQPIGTRDTASVERLSKLGIDAYWSGCVTLHLGRRLKPVPLSERKGILFVDVKPAEEEKFVPQHIRDQAVRISSFVSKSMRDNQLERFAWLARLVDRLRHARLVVTRRLHVALPCVGMGTPVIALPVPRISAPRYRFSGFDTFLPVRYNDEPWGNEIPFDWDDPQPTVVPPVIEEGYAKFCAYLRGLGVLDESIVPEDDQHWPRGGSNWLYRFKNPTGDGVPGSVLLRLGDRVYRPIVYDWTNEEIALKLHPFPGFEKLRFTFKIDSRGIWENNKSGSIAELGGRFVAN